VGTDRNWRTYFSCWYYNQ